MAIKSPCIGICDLNGTYQCIGCLRTVDEIKNWQYFTSDEKLSVWDRILKGGNYAYFKNKKDND